MAISIREILLSIMLIGTSFAINAQTACPQGVAAGSVQCGPSGASMLGNGTTMAMPPRQLQARWMLTWGALAYDPKTGWVGSSTGQKSKKKAERAAIENCKSKGGSKDCQAVLPYRHQCAAVVIPREDLGQNFPYFLAAGSAEIAAKLGLEKCRDMNAGHECKILYSNCTEPYLVYD